MSIAFYLLYVCVWVCTHAHTRERVCTCSHALVYVGKHVTCPAYGSQKTTCKSQFSILPGRGDRRLCSLSRLIGRYLFLLGILSNITIVLELAQKTQGSFSLVCMS